MKEDLEGEIWKDIIGYEGLYQVSNMGRVKSLPKEWVTGLGKIRKHNGKILKPNITGAGYYYVNLYKDKKGESKQIHKLVAMVFLNHIPNSRLIVIDHIDNNRLNNKLDNLQIITSRENTSKNRNGSSKYVGVSWNKQMNKWQCQIEINYKGIYLGCFDNEEDAGKMYQNALANINKYNNNNKKFRELCAAI